MKHLAVVGIFTSLLVLGPWPVVAQDNPIHKDLIGTWKEQTPGVKEGSTFQVVSIDPATGALKGKWTPPTGSAKGTTFDVVGWVSSIPPAMLTPATQGFDNVVTVAWSVSLTPYGSITSYTGFFKDNKLMVMWQNVRPVSRYEWDHVTANQATFVRVQ